MTMPCKRIAIIGGGASAALLLAALDARTASGLTVDIFDRSGRFARGVAYSTPHDHHLLNVRAANMSGLAGIPDHFARWAAPHGVTPTDFAPRRLFGDYLESLMSAAQSHHTVNLIAADIKSSKKTKDGFVLDERPDTYDAVILATGNVVPLGPRAENAGAGYFADPWAITPDDVKNAQRIALIGTGLTAVDAVLTLRSYGYDGNITMISRRTLLPATHTDPATWPHPPLSADDADKPLSHLLAMVRLHAGEAAQQDIPWHAVIDSLRPVTNPLWAAFSPAQKERFNRRLLTLWNVHRHRMAPSIAAQMDDLMQSGKLTLHRDGVKNILPGPVVEGTRSNESFDIVINCMGYRYHEKDRHFDYTHAIGPARFGDSWFETTAIPEIRAQANDIAAELTA